MNPYTLEVCIDSVVSAKSAQEGGAQRVELCAALYEGGLTPSMGMIEQVLDAVDIDVMVIIRPRGGDFNYSEDETKVMMKDIKKLNQMGVKGVVIGALNKQGGIDQDCIKQLVGAAEGLDTTFHRAFDMGKNPYIMLDQLIDLGITRLLTSGQEADAFEGRNLIAELVQRGGTDINIMAGGGITEENVLQLINDTGLREIHATCSEVFESPMVFRRNHVYMGVKGYPEFQQKQSTKQKVEAVFKQIRLAKGKD